jgi:peptidoglycan/xylan/chitin deacetylase (PgdA/CDA1 family)
MTNDRISRRRVIRDVGFGVAGVGAISGSAVAHDNDDDGDDTTTTTTTDSGSNSDGTDTGTDTGEKWWESYDGPKVVLTFDHISPSIFDTAAPILQEYDYPALMAVVTDRVSPGEIQRLRDLQAQGWEVGSHSLTKHPAFTDLSRDELVRQARGSKEWLVEHDFARRGGSIVYPYGAADQRVADAVRPYYAVGFWGGDHTGDPLLYGRVNGDEVERTKRAVAEAAETDGTVVVMYHTVGADNDRVTTTGFRETMAYIERQDVRVVPASALAPE